MLQLLQINKLMYFYYVLCEIMSTEVPFTVYVILMKFQVFLVYKSSNSIQVNNSDLVT